MCFKGVITMKRTILLAILLLSLFLLVGCSQEKSIPVIEDDVDPCANGACDVPSVDYSQKLASCEEITDPENKGDCISEIALLSDNLELCFDAGPMGSKCLEAVANARGDSSICRYVTRDAYKDNCFTDAAVKEKNPDLCEEVNDRQQSACYMNYAEFVGNINVCSKVLSTYTDGCYQLVATVEKNIAICDKISNKNSVPFSKCVNDVAMAKNSPSDCAKLPTEATINNCRYNLALEYKNLATCNLITSEDKKAQCISELS